MSQIQRAQLPLIIEHPISLYFVEASGIVDAFSKLLKSYQEGGKILKLDPEEDTNLIDRLDAVIKYAFPVENSSIAMNPEIRRLGMYYRRFGLKIKGKPDIPTTDDTNSNFYNTFRDVMVNIFQGIQDKDVDTVRIADPGRLAQLLNNLRDQLRYYNINNVNRITRQWTVIFQELVRELNSERLLKALNIRINSGLNDRLKGLGSAVNVPVSEVMESHILLAQRMAAFLIEVEDRIEWTTEDAERLYSEPKHENMFREIATHWNLIDPQIDFAAMALLIRPK